MNNYQLANNIYGFLFDFPNIIFALNEINKFISNQYEQMKQNFELLMTISNLFFEKSKEINIENIYELNSNKEKNIDNLKNVCLDLINKKKEYKIKPFFTVTYRKTK